MKLTQVDMPYWPSGMFRGLCELSLSVDEVEERFGLKFRSDRDDLGPYEWAAAELEGFGCVLFMIYTESLEKLVVIYVDLAEEPSSALRTVVARLQLRGSEILKSG
ncbi:hypothetical protein DFR29_1076 [Tahibacter aquaticus]|uniref:Uncharacterized protein n=1 Tax=Tahibacter aquaticus TaxID=520092 RepID=A0A4R6YWJ2_9GAMM|nr:hypothetical protein [Tahibacter aquaticus]TDR43002.1 hypothetical protein DFR29_1076 [Tahibacter aquaticus]